MKKKLLILTSLMAFFNVSCASAPTQIISDNNKNTVLETLSKISDETGKLSEEDVNVTVYENTIQSVVSINSTSVSRDFFRSTRSVRGTGSGVLVNENGYIVTNYHVVMNASKLEVTISDKSTWPAEKVGGDKDSDIAIIKIKAPSDRFKIASWGDSSNLKVGQKVYAIGSPFGLFGTLTTGIISSLKRELPADDGTMMKDIIQTDAAINPGNSGGPLLNSKGDLIGINTAIFSPNGGNVGIGFAIPSNKIKEIINKIQANLK